MLAQLDGWIDIQQKRPSRPEAIRILMLKGLAELGPAAAERMTITWLLQRGDGSAMQIQTDEFTLPALGQTRVFYKVAYRVGTVLIGAASLPTNYVIALEMP
jgi:hypothetical protein